MPENYRGLRPRTLSGRTSFQDPPFQDPWHPPRARISGARPFTFDLPWAAMETRALAAGLAYHRKIERTLIVLDQARRPLVTLLSLGGAS